MSVNKAIIVGRLGKDPELRFTQGGKARATFSIATDSVWKDKDGQRQKQTEWHNIVVWGPQGENCSKYLTKGREVYVEGEIRTRSYEKDGAKHYITEIVAQNVKFLSGGERGAPRDGGMNEGPDAMGGFGGAPEADDDIPF